MARTWLYYEWDFDRAAMDARLLAYYKSTHGGNAQALWSTVFALTEGPYSMRLDSRVTSGFTAREADTNIIFEGESTTCGINASVGNAWGEKLMLLPAWTGKGIKFQHGQSSQTIEDITSQYTNDIYPNRPTGGIVTSYLFIDIGLKNIAADESAATIMGKINTYLDTANGDGFTTILLNKWPNGSMTTDQKTQVTLLNGLIMASAKTLMNIDVATALGAPPASGSNTNFQDPVHQSNTGHALEAATIAAAFTP